MTHRSCARELALTSCDRIRQNELAEIESSVKKLLRSRSGATKTLDQLTDEQREQYQALMKAKSLLVRTRERESALDRPLTASWRADHQGQEHAAKEDRDEAQGRVEEGGGRQGRRGQEALLPQEEYERAANRCNRSRRAHAPTSVYVSVAAAELKKQELVEKFNELKDKRQLNKVGAALGSVGVLGVHEKRRSRCDGTSTVDGEADQASGAEATRAHAS